jgi:hypothetical protein
MFVKTCWCLENFRWRILLRNILCRIILRGKFFTRNILRRNNFRRRTLRMDLFSRLGVKFCAGYFFARNILRCIFTVKKNRRNLIFFQRESFNSGIFRYFSSFLFFKHYYSGFKLNLFFRKKTIET